MREFPKLDSTGKIDKSLLPEIAIIQPAFKSPYIDSQTFTLPKPIVEIINCYLWNQDGSFYLLQEDDYTTLDNTITITSHTLSENWRIKVIYIAY